MKVCMLAYTFYERDNRVRRYAESLARQGHTVEAIALRRGDQPAEEILEGVRVLRIQRRVVDESSPISYLLKLLAFFLRSFCVISLRHLRSPYKLIHVHSVPDFEVFATLIPRLTGARIILDIHDIVPEFYASKFRVRESSIVFRALVFMERLSCAFAHHVIIANDLWYERIIRRSVPAGKCTSIINFPDLNIFAPPLHAEDENSSVFRIGYPGTLNWHQGVDLAVQAIALLRDRLPNLHFSILGDGKMRDELQSMIVARGLSDRITLTGLVPMEAVAEAMRQTDLGLVPKRAEGFGNEAFSTKIMEFMAMGVPVCATRTQVDEFYFNDSLIEFFASGNPADMANHIERLVLDSNRRHTLRTNALAFIAENSWAVKEQIYLSLVRRLAA